VRVCARVCGMLRAVRRAYRRRFVKAYRGLVCTCKRRCRNCREQGITECCVCGLLLVW
jgi:hypothetical protein